MREFSFGTIVASFVASTLAVISVVTVIDNNRLQDQVDKYKNLMEVNREQVIQTQLKYERDKDAWEKISASLTQDVYEANQRTVKARASRSRPARPSVRVSSAGNGASQLGVRDITMYCPTGNTTASGKWPARGMVATISRAIPFGTRVQIDGLGTFVVEDRIGHGSEFDIYTPSCAEAERFGRRHRAVRILDSN